MLRRKVTPSDMFVARRYFINKQESSEIFEIIISELLCFVWRASGDNIKLLNEKEVWLID